MTLFDFQLAEQMNKEFQITNKWFSKYPILTSKSWSSIKIFIVTFFLFNFTLQIGTHWGLFYPSASQRGEKPQAGHYRPLIVTQFEFASGGVRSERDIDLYAKAYVDDYAFKRHLFSSSNMW